jgi:small subunit ribosomal protein S21
MENKKPKGRSVVVKDYENINQALRRFKKKVDDSNVLDELRDNEFYIKPTTARKKAKSAAKARWQKILREQQLPKKLY